MKQIQIFLIAFLLSTCGAYAQSATNVSGGKAKIGDATFSYSIGEMTMVNTISSSDLIVTQGLLQPTNNTPTTTRDIIISQEQLNVYPNPTNGIVNLQPNFNSEGSMQLVLLDLAGKVVLRKNVSLDQGNELQKINVANLATGNYMLNVNFQSKNSISKNTYKIQKLNQ